MTAQATTPLRAITYNLAGRRDVTAQLTLCDQRGWDVLLVQEATAATLPKLAAHPSVRQADTAFAHRRFASRDRPLLVGVDANAPNTTTSTPRHHPPPRRHQTVPSRGQFSFPVFYNLNQSDCRYTHRPPS